MMASAGCGEEGGDPDAMAVSTPPPPPPPPLAGRAKGTPRLHRPTPHRPAATTSSTGQPAPRATKRRRTSTSPRTQVAAAGSGTEEALAPFAEGTSLVSAWKRVARTLKFLLSQHITPSVENVTKTCGVGLPTIRKLAHVAPAAVSLVWRVKTDKTHGASEDLYAATRRGELGEGETEGHVLCFACRSGASAVSKKRLQHVVSGLHGYWREHQPKLKSAAAATATTSAAAAAPPAQQQPPPVPLSCIPEVPRGSKKERRQAQNLTGRHTPYEGDFCPHKALGALKGLPLYENQLIHQHVYPGRPVQLGKLDRALPTPIQKALASMGIDSFFSHQATAINAARSGCDVVLSTPTSSGKSLTFICPVVEAILEDPASVSLFLFPTKALAQDQLGTLQSFVGTGWFGETLRCATLDGDTSKSLREDAHEAGNIILSNPDMLHITLLPNHNQWGRIFDNLKYVVLDEAHVYCGAFGAHIGCILRRLLRVCNPKVQFICCSATLSNPEQHFRNLVPDLGRRRLVSVRKNGAPSGERVMALWEAPRTASRHFATAEGRRDALAVDAALATTPSAAKPAAAAATAAGSGEERQRKSAIFETALLMSALVKSGVRTLVFCMYRKLVELVMLWVVRDLQRTAPHLVPLVRSYRAGYSQEERRDIERGLFEGTLLGVVATNALELGVDIGSLDATVSLGFPSSVSSLWQQIGRAGRGRRPALNIVSLWSSPLDQYYAHHPDKLFVGRKAEDAIVDPESPRVLREHLICAAAELPLDFRQRDGQLFGKGALPQLLELVAAQVLLLDPDDTERHVANPAMHWPARRVNIRTVQQDNVSVQLESSTRVIDVIELGKSLFEVYTGAVYLNQGATYVIKILDLKAGVAIARRKEVDYFTKPRDYSNINVVQQLDRHADSHWGVVEVKKVVFGYRKYKADSMQLIEMVTLQLPSIKYFTRGLWFDIPPHCKADCEAGGLDFVGGVHAVGHLLLHSFRVFVICDHFDINTEHPSPHRKHSRPMRVVIHDTRVGGIGLTEAMAPRGKELLEVALDLVSKCACKTGCPSCVHSTICTEANIVIDKAAAQLILCAFLADWGNGPATASLLPLSGKGVAPKDDGRIIVGDIEPTPHEDTDHMHAHH